ncbi:4-(cytidine 5'-diphospho)-2-C-methyl-D-erythritol kinase [Pseudothioclava arenosa]|uniref:4-diphosphocytidyl-2-C-methyl-D-erythritol kinase n=1 Tax=Pseudothioclava arenosa TaxID=1795308 RepID=A0A2A4CM72_9RHOB|nr:4-(cytidine 5'-diphospho)-2-C-methyl-D-erythritol kinase [Pseudothioclava arenosa]PCD75695.1 4-(cytidine 5'-diphospho)-2-C-methyl-D-erythritol kinase [Pseudothioclava arenosa]
MPTFEALAPAKVNLTLLVTGLRDDGYHLLESLVVFAGVGDQLRVEPAETLSLSVSGPRAAGVPEDGRNLVLKAAERLRALRGVTAGARISLEKHLPHGGGIGGGSSDAATAIRLLSQLWGVAPLTRAEALPLGADIPVCLAAPAPRLMCGIGEDLSPVPALPSAWLVLVNPGVEMPTPKVFRAFDAAYPPTAQRHAPLPPTPDFEAFTAWLHGHHNDLTKVLNDPQGEAYVPQIAEILTVLSGAGGTADCDMSGSGSTCWGLFADEPAARTAAAALAATHPDWWVTAAPILSDHAAP